MNIKNILIMKKIILLVSAFILLFGIFINYSIAVGNENNTRDNIFDSGRNIKIRMSPQFPGPNENVNVTLSSSSFNFDRARTVVKIDGKVITGVFKDSENKTYPGEYSFKNFSFKTKGNGQRTLIEIESTNYDGLVYKTKRYIIPASVDLIYEAYESYRPPFYKGKADILNDSKVKIVAMPELYNTSGQKIDPSDLIYNWRINYSADLKNSGYGKNYYIIDRIKSGPIKTTVSVRVETKNGKIVAEKRIIILPKRANIIFYLQKSEQDFSLRKPILGGRMETEQNKIAIRAIPYFMNDIHSKNITRDTWFFNGVEQKLIEGRELAPIDNTISGGQILKITLKKIIENKFRPLQAATGYVTVEFEKVKREIYNKIEEKTKQASSPVEKFLTS